jgi:hypothetical protein
MSRLTLLDLNGEPIPPSAVKNINAGVNSIKILLLGDGYPANKQSQYRNHVRHFVKTIVSTHPFLILKAKYNNNFDYLQKVMFFRAEAISDHWGPQISRTSDPVKYPLTPPNHKTKFGMRLDIVNHQILPSLYYDSSGNINMIATPIIDFISNLTHRYSLLRDSNGQQITASDIWLNSHSNSYGLVSTICPYPVDIYIGNCIRAFYGTPPNKNYFPAVFSVADMKVPFWPYITLHEIGHSLGLEDEYDFGNQEFPINTSNAPNLLYRSQMVNNPVLNNKVSQLNESDINLQNVNINRGIWYNNMSQDDRISFSKRHDGYFAYQDFWSTDPLLHVRLSTSNRPVASTSFPPNPQRSIQIESYAVLTNHPGDSQQSVWRFPYAYSRPRVMLVEGATNNQRNIYRSNLECIMRIPTPVDPISDNPLYKFPPEFCLVCQSHIKQKLHL